jgi:hypothetical protein
MADQVAAGQTKDKTDQVVLETRPLLLQAKEITAVH